jgi:alkylation response protein AidB-like acyl-CoA dehydrogenase
MNFAPSPDQLRWRDAARAFARERCAPLVRQADADGRFPIELVPDMGALGLLAGPVDAALGGSGMDYVSFALVYEELGYVDSSIRGFLAVHGGLVTLCLRDHGTPAQQAEYTKMQAEQQNQRGGGGQGGGAQGGGRGNRGGG